MNERIRVFAEQCYEKHELLDTYEFNKEKFAELIVRECCVTADANIDDSKYPSYWIKKKFGVKE